MKENAGFHVGAIRLALRSRDLTSADRLLESQPTQSDRGQRGSRRLRLFLMGERALAGKDPDSALRYFRDAVAERAPVYGMEWFEDCLASAYSRIGKFDAAIEEYQRVLGTYRRLALTWYGLAKAYQAKGRREDARKAFQKMLEIWEHGDQGIPERVEAET